MIAEQAGSGILSLLDWMPTPPQERNSPSDCSAGPPPTQNLFKSFRTPGNFELEPSSSIGKPTNSLSPEKTISAFFSKRKMDSLHTLVEPGDKTRVCIRYLNVRLWLLADILSSSELRPLYTRKRTSRKGSLNFRF